MSEPADRSSEVARSSPDQEHARGPSSPSELRLLRWHLLVLAVALAVHANVTGAMEVELFDPPPTFSRDTNAVVFAVHDFSLLSLIGPACFAVLPLLLRAAGAAVPLAWPRWLLWPALVAWAVGLLVVALRLVGLVDITLTTWAWLAVCQAVLAYALGAAAGVVAAGWATLRRSWPLGIALLVAAAGMTLAVDAESLRVFGRDRPWPSTLAFATLAPLLLTMILAVIEPLRHEAGVPAVPGWALVVCMLGMVAGPTGYGVLALPVLIFVLVRAARSLLVDRVWAARPLVFASLVSFAVLALGIGLGAFLGTLSVDVHLHDTYFPMALVHVVATVLLLMMLGAILEQAPALLGRQPHRRLGLAGLLALGGGMGLVIVSMLALGQDGMPKHYYAYVPQFQAQHRAVGLGGAIAAVGLLLVAAAIGLGRRARVEPVA